MTVACASSIIVDEEMMWEAAHLDSISCRWEILASERITLVVSNPRSAM